MYIALILIILAIKVYVHYENLNLEVTHYTIHSKNIPMAFQGVRFVVLSDLHNNSFGKDNVRLLDEIDKVNPEFIIVAGDMIIGNVLNDYSIVLSLLSNLVARYKVYYGYGNHEQRVMSGGECYDEHFDDYKESLQRLGVHFLNNEQINIYRNEDSITITGLQIGAEYFRKRKQPKFTTEYLQKLVGISDNQCYNILIAHNPVYFKNYMEYGADLILSGHIHGGIIRLPFARGLISPQYKFFPKYDAGRFEENGKIMLVSRGLGMHTIKIRMFNRPELMVVTLER